MKTFIITLAFLLFSGCATVDQFIDKHIKTIRLRPYSKKTSDPKIKDQTLPKGLKRQVPYLTKTKIRMYWEPDQIKGNKYIEAHRVWVIEANQVWTQKD